jgi:gluconolactonase
MSDMADASAFAAASEAFGEVTGPAPRLRRIAQGLKFTEGPVWLPQERCLVFSDIPPGIVYRWQDGRLTELRNPSGNANGNALDLQGRLVSCEHGTRSLTRRQPDGRQVTLGASFRGKPLNSPNDVVVKGDGTIWFTDPPYGIKPQLSQQDGNYVFRLDGDGAEPVVVAGDFDRPNGLCFSPDERLLYIGDSSSLAHVRRFEVLPDNTLRGGDMFARIEPGVPDGMKVDAAGRLYCTAGDGVHVLAPGGELLGKILTPAAASNCAFGGDDGRTLFITARGEVWAADIAARGAARPGGL